MKRIVFISHSSADKSIAEEICRFLENHNVPCWIAPRDVTPGKNYGAAILDAIDECAVFLLVLTKDSNKSGQVVREVERAATSNSIIIPFRVQDVQPSRDLEFYVSATHWLDAVSKPFDKHLHELLKAIKNWQEATDTKESSQPSSAAPARPLRSISARPSYLGSGGTKLIIGSLVALFFCIVPGYLLLRHKATPRDVSSVQPSPAPAAPTVAETSALHRGGVPEVSPAAVETPPVVPSKLGQPLKAVPSRSAPVVGEVVASSEWHVNGEVRKASQAFDGIPGTSWAAEGDGIGQSLSVHFKAPADIASISILAAVGTDFEIRNRLHTVRITFSDGTHQVLTLEDRKKFQRFELAHHITTDWVKFDILSVYRGKTMNHTPIFEIAFNREPE